MDSSHERSPLASGPPRAGVRSASAETPIVLPRTATVNLTASAPGLQLALDGQLQTAPYSTLAVVGMQRSIGAPIRPTVGGSTYQFRSWSDGGSATHNIIVPAVNTTYTATYRQKRR